MGKPILCLDFDGVVHSYISGWKGITIVSDPPVPGALEFIKTALEQFDVCVYSSRSSHPSGINAMLNWLSMWARRVDKDNWWSWLQQVRFPEQKPAAFLTIDDRAITFEGTWPDVQGLLAFKPWNKR